MSVFRLKNFLLILFVSTGIARPLQSAPVHAFHTLNYMMKVDLYHCFAPPFPRSFNASLIISLKADSILQSVKLNADTSSLTIDSVSLAGVSFSHLNNILTVNLNRYYDAGENIDIKIYYRHNDVSDNAFFAGNGMVFTNCEPEGARKWFPCHDIPSDKATFDLTVMTPLNVKLGSNGALADSTIRGDTIYYHWVSIDPVATYLVVMAAATDYILKTLYWHKPSNPADSVPVRFYSRPGENTDAVANAIVPLADFYSGLFCEYPFQKAGFASMNELFYGGGMENQTLITLCSTCWRESLAAHEFAHMWFGDMITCATWADLWLNEGFATWSTVYWQEHNQGYDSYKTFLIDRYAKEYILHNPGWALSDSSWALRTPSFDTLFNTAVTYMKGACMVHQLRYVLGDSVFLEVLKSYCNDTTFRFQSATIGDLMKVVNRVSGNDYNWFFHDWVFQPNHPKYKNSYDLVQNGGNSWTVRCITKQTQVNPAFFRIVLTFRIVFTDSSTADIRVMNDSNNQLFTWNFGKEPVRLVFDPDTNIMLKEGTTNLGIREITPGPESFTLFQNVPNPAKDRTDIPYYLQDPAQVCLEILDLNGRIISKPLYGFKSAGRHILDFDCSTFSSGTYFYRMVAGSHTDTKKMVVTRGK
jgi:aminopeptidase N